MEEWRSDPEVRTIVPYGYRKHPLYGDALPRQLPANVRFRYSLDLGQTFGMWEKGRDYEQDAYGNLAPVCDMARPVAAAITIENELIILHAEPTPELALWRVSHQLGIAYDEANVQNALLMKLIQKHYPKTLHAAGRRLTHEERQMSIAYVVDLKRQHNEPIGRTIERSRQTLIDYNLVTNQRDTTLEQYFTEGMALLRKIGLLPWEKPLSGRPREKSEKKSS